MADRAAEITAIFFAIVCTAYLMIFFNQYRQHTPGTERLTVMNSRTAIFLPLYSIFIYISLNAPKALTAMEVPMTFIEGYSFYCFFVMIVTNLGGPAGAVQAFKDSGKSLMCCNSFCNPNNDAKAYYIKTTKALFHFVITRTIITLIAAIAYYSSSKVGKVVFAALSVVSSVLLFYCLPHLILFYENVLPQNVNLFGVVKFGLLKVSVGLMVLQGLVYEFMNATDSQPYNDDETWSAEEKTERGYCALILLEYVILSLPYLYAFGIVKITPRQDAAKGSSSSTNVAPLTLGSYVLKVFSFHDVIGALTFKDEDALQLTPNL